MSEVMAEEKFGKETLITSEELTRIVSEQMGPWSSTSLPVFRIVSNRPHHLVVKVPVHTSLTNARNDLHGGAIASLVDVLTSLALFADDPRPSVTVDLHVTHLCSAPANSIITVDSKVEKIGQNMVFSSCHIYGEDRRLVAKASHTKRVEGMLSS